MALFTQVAEFYGNFDPLVAKVQKMLEEANTVEKNQVSQYLGNQLYELFILFSLFCRSYSQPMQCFLDIFTIEGPVTIIFICR